MKLWDVSSENCIFSLAREYTEETVGSVGSPLFVAAAALFILGTGALWLLTMPVHLGKWWRPVVDRFAGPGLAVWWLTMGGPFQTTPRNLPGILWSALANTAFWMALVVLVPVAIRRLKRWTGPKR